MTDLYYGDIRVEAPEQEKAMATEIIETRPNEIIGPQDGPGDGGEAKAILAVIERAANNPDVDVEKMERLLSMQERILDRHAKASYTSALAEMQPKLPVVTEHGEIKNNAGKVQSKYAYWEDIIEAIRPILSDHGFALSFRVGRDGDQTTVTAVLSHREGHSEETTIYLPADVSGSKNAVQAVGSSVAYGKRYTTTALLNLTSGGEDDDGTAAATSYITDEQKEQIVGLLKETGSDTKKFLAYMGVESVDQIPSTQFNKAKTALEAKKGKK